MLGVGGSEIFAHTFFNARLDLTPRHIMGVQGRVLSSNPVHRALEEMGRCSGCAKSLLLKI